MDRYDARLLLERLRNKRLMFVGDSLNRNQWESMVCLVQSVVPWGHKTLQKFVNNGSLNVFTAHGCMDRSIDRSAALLVFLACHL